MARGARLLAVALAGSTLFAAALAEAQEIPPPEEARAKHSPYEQGAIDIALAQRRAELEPSPEGKVIESIEVAPGEVLEARDLPSFLEELQFLNYLHGTTRPYVLRQEVLARRGEPYRQALVDETARNLRSLRPLSLVLIVPLRGSAPDRVRLLVITKDIWSLRLNTDFRIAGGKLDFLTLQPSEENLFGTHQSIGAFYNLEPETYALGGRYITRRIGGSRLEGRFEANVIINRNDPLEAGNIEGTRGGFAFGQPLYSTAAQWAWSTRITWRDEITRRYVGGEVGTFDAERTPAVEDIPFKWKTDRVFGALSVTRGFGSTIRHEVSLAMEGDRRVYRTGDLSAYAPEAVAEFVETELPVSDTRIGPALTYRTYSSRYLRVLDLDTLGLQEDYPIGHILLARVYPSIKALKSSRDYLGLQVGAGYTVPLGDGLARASVESITDIEADRLADASIEGGLRIMTPTFRFARLAYDARVLHRYRNYQNRQDSIGGESRLRGYPSLAFIGKDVVVSNLELRTKPVALWSLQLGAAAFYDAGDAFDGFSNMRLKQSVGVGLRSLIPMLDRVVFRADLGFPLDREFAAVPTAAVPFDVVVTFSQAFPMPRQSPAESL